MRHDVYNRIPPEAVAAALAQAGRDLAFFEDRRPFRQRLHAEQFALTSWHWSRRDTVRVHAGGAHVDGVIIGTRMADLDLGPTFELRVMSPAPGSITFGPGEVDDITIERAS